MKTYGVRYLGSKGKLITHITNRLAGLPIHTAIDVFAGTTRVAQALKQQGVTVTTSDLSWATTAYAHTFITNESNQHLLPLITELNSLPPKAGWLTENYCGTQFDAQRDYGRLFQPKNAMRADAIRDHIETLSLAPWEKHTLITSLIFALDAVDNTVGIQQAYLKEWCSRSRNNLNLKLPPSVVGPRGTHIEGDALKIEYPEADLAYLDPPYSPADYATYYHVWDSIVRWDKPETGLTGHRRRDRIAGSDVFDTAMDSPWYSKNTALQATKTLIERLPVRYVLFSYNDMSIIKPAELHALLQEYGKVSMTEINYKRHIMSQIGMAAKKKDKVTKNNELLLLLDKTGAELPLPSQEFFHPKKVLCPSPPSATTLPI